LIIKHLESIEIITQNFWAAEQVNNAKLLLLLPLMVMANMTKYMIIEAFQSHLGT
jgi:hypothetical protein